MGDLFLDIHSALGARHWGMNKCNLCSHGIALCSEAVDQRPSEHMMMNTMRAAKAAMSSSLDLSDSRLLGQRGGTQWSPKASALMCSGFPILSTVPGAQQTHTSAWTCGGEPSSEVT